MSPAEILIHDSLQQRRQQLAVVPDLAERPELVGLLLEVDSALERLDHDDWGVCTVCREGVESDRLLADPVVSVCLGCLSAEQRRALEHDLTTAAHIQAALLPPARLEITGWKVASVYQPLGAVSGDYIDIVRQPDDGGALIAFGDVAGKGVAAAMVMSHLHALLRTLSQMDLSLPELLERANAMLLAATTASCYATLLVVQLSEDGSLEIANGGHPPPIVVRADGVKALPVTGMPVGLLPGARFRTHTTRLGPGDSLLLFTDGLSEAPDANGSEFGQRRIASIAARSHGRPAEEALAAALEDLDAFLGDSPRIDDLSLMAIERL